MKTHHLSRVHTHTHTRTHIIYPTVLRNNMTFHYIITCVRLLLQQWRSVTAPHTYNIGTYTPICNIDTTYRTHNIYSYHCVRNTWMLIIISTTAFIPRPFFTAFTADDYNNILSTHRSERLSKTYLEYIYIYRL